MCAMKRLVKLILYLNCMKLCQTHKSTLEARMDEIFSWKQMSYNFDGFIYDRDANVSLDAIVYLDNEITEEEKFFIQYNNVPVGLEVFGDRVFITVPRRRYGIPSTLNYVRLPSTKAPALKPYPDVRRSGDLVSVYRPRVDVCNRLWMVDTGLLEVPGARVQVQKPAIVVYDLMKDTRIFKYELRDLDLVNERSPGGFTSITVDVTKDNCGDAYAYITDLATEGLVVFSMRLMDSWRIWHDSFQHQESALNFTVAGQTIPWKDGLFSVALSEPKADGSRTAYYHPLVSFSEYTVNTNSLKNPISPPTFEVLGYKGKNTQSGTHGFHEGTKTLLYGNVAQDAILCWRVTDEMAPENVAIAVQDHKKLVYIADLKIVNDDVWVLVNQIPRHVLSTLNTTVDNFFVHRAKVKDLIKGTACDGRKLDKDRIIFQY